MKAEERQELIDALLDNDISEADFIRLEAEMQVDPGARMNYYERLKLETALKIEASAMSTENRPTTGRSHRSVDRSKLGWLGWIAAGVMSLLVAELASEIHKTNQNISSGNADIMASGFGVIAEQSDTDWQLERSDLLPPGNLKLNSGIAKLELFSGATIIVEAPAEFSIDSAHQVSIRSGKISAHVPEFVNGFQIETGSGETFPVKNNLVLQVSQGQKALELPEINELKNRMSAHLNDRHEVWKNFKRELQNDPRLLVYFPMAETNNPERQLPDQSANRNDGSIIRAIPVADRWGEPFGGLEFTPTGSRVRVNITGDLESLTMMCWAKIDSLDRLYNSLFLTDGHDIHEPHWQIMDDGRLFFSVKARKATKKLKDKHIAFSPPVWTPANSGQWMHIATVFDGKAMSTTHYLNGKMISKDLIPDDMKPEMIRIGAASIGNWNDPTQGNDPSFAIRNLNGTIDEFAIFSAPLSSDEIFKLYEIGKP